MKYNESDIIKSDTIIRLVSEFFRIDQTLMMSKTRKREFCQPRMIAIYFVKQRTKLTLKSIGKVFSGLDHATILNAIKVVNDLIETDATIREYIEELTYIVGELVNLPEDVIMLDAPSYEDFAKLDPTTDEKAKEYMINKF
jgi:chromosomal replication initiation ATPase DnaA